MSKKIYINKINYYSNKLTEGYKYDSSEFNKAKLQKYLIKIGGGKTICNKESLELEYDESRTPSNCDRILYKSEGSIKSTAYGVYSDNYLIRLSDHLLVYGKFNYNNSYHNINGIILTWNIAGIHSHTNIRSGLSKLILDLGLLDGTNDMIIFCLQESSSNDIFPKILTDQLSAKYEVLSESSKSFLDDFKVRLMVFYKKGLPKLISSSSILNLEPRFPKSILNNKTCVALTIDGLTILSCHFPLDTKEKDFGNELRLDAMKKIKEEFKDSKNILLAGDLNFRIVDESDQLTTYLSNQSGPLVFKEFEPKLTIKTCKLKTCK